MKWRFGFLMCCAIVVILAGATVASGREVPLVCCESPTACDAGQTCCDAEVVGTGACDPEFRNYCMEVCKRVAFTPDPR